MRFLGEYDGLEDVKPKFPKKSRLDLVPSLLEDVVRRLLDPSSRVCGSWATGLVEFSSVLGFIERSATKNGLDQRGFRKKAESEVKAFASSMIVVYISRHGAPVSLAFIDHLYRPNTLVPIPEGAVGTKECIICD